MNKHAVILGIGSDIGAAMSKRLLAGGWIVTGLHHTEGEHLPGFGGWDLVICCYGTTEPIGSFWAQGDYEWEAGVHANALLPLRHVRALYPTRRSGASVCFFSGAGASGPAPSYSAYAASKVMLTKMTELLDDESPDCKFFILGPGVVRTKILDQAVAAGSRAANHERVEKFLDSNSNGTPMDDIYECMMACVAAPKAGVGGRNICVHLDSWRGLGELDGVYGPDMFKLRRVE